MVCPKCNSPTSVVDSRPLKFGTKRRRKCIAKFRCNHRFNTIEITEASYNGSTPDSKPVNVGSIPTASAKKYARESKQKFEPFSLEDTDYTDSLSDDELERLIHLNRRD